jgi:hypothetical protein
MTSREESSKPQPIEELNVMKANSAWTTDKLVWDKINELIAWTHSHDKNL